MAKLRKLVGWLPAVGAMIFNGCVIGWLHCTKPQLLGSSVPGNVIAVGYTILFLLWWCLAPAATACVIGGPFFLWCAALLPAELLFALTARSSSKAFAVIAKMGMPAFAASGSSAGKAAAAGTAILTSCAGRTASGRTAAGSACYWQRSCWQCRRAGACGAAGCT